MKDAYHKKDLRRAVRRAVVLQGSTSVRSRVDSRHPSFVVAQKAGPHEQNTSLSAPMSATAELAERNARGSTHQMIALRCAYGQEDLGPTHVCHVCYGGGPSVEIASNSKAPFPLNIPCCGRSMFLALVTAHVLPVKAFEINARREASFLGDCSSGI